jgi:hypothetical protein
MAKQPKRSLYQCFNAKVRGDRIECAKGHNLGYKYGKIEDSLSIRRLIRGAPLELAVCQECPDYDEMGPPIPKEERGWKE